MPSALKAGLLGGLVLFAWGMLSWMTMPYHTAVMHKFSNEIEVSEIIKAGDPKPGIYTIPAKLISKNDKPFVFASVQPNGYPMSKGQKFAVGLGLDIVFAVFVSHFVSLTKTRSYRRRLLLVVGLGFLMAVSANLPLWNWWGFNLDYVSAAIIDSVIGWALAGIVIARFAGNPH